MSTHEVKVIRIAELLPHPNADKLEMVKVNGYTALVPKGTYSPGDLAAYVEPDYVVPDTADFAFLKGKRRIGAVRLRGVWSEGLLVKAPAGAVEGDDVMAALGIERWQPPESDGPRPHFNGPPLGCLASVPEFVREIPKYDLEPLQKFTWALIVGEDLRITEKLHGTNARYVFHDGQFYAGSRTQWRREEPKNVYWDAVKQNPWIRGWCENHPDVVMWGEIFGDVQDLNYGADKGTYNFRVFDMYRNGQWLPHYNFHAAIQQVPELKTMTWNGDLAELREIAELDSVFGGIREGIVVEPVEPRYGVDMRGNSWRAKFKLVSNRYLSR